MMIMGLYEFGDEWARLHNQLHN